MMLYKTDIYIYICLVQHHSNMCCKMRKTFFLVTIKKSIKTLTPFNFHFFKCQLSEITNEGNEFLKEKKLKIEGRQKKIHCTLDQVSDSLNIF